MGPGVCMAALAPLCHLWCPVPYSGPGPLPAMHCWGVVLKGTWLCSGRGRTGLDPGRDAEEGC